ncbi:MAG: hypothetical protein IT577_19115 [Verrucomicrobiae bacterium]|nr:hypothetical protein [Verrucomicrobiae bacterium]
MKHAIKDAGKPGDLGLGALLRESIPDPPLPARFRESVWRRIRVAEAETPPSTAWLDRWVERLLLPRFAIAGLAMLLAAGVLAGGIAGADDAKSHARERYLASVAPGALR